MQSNRKFVPMPQVTDERFAEAMERIAREDPSRVYLKFDDRTYTVQEVNRLANQLANALLQQGLKSGDHVGLMLPNHPLHAIAIFALMKAGLIRVPVNIHAKGSSLEHYFKSFGIRLLIAADTFTDLLTQKLDPALQPEFFWLNLSDSNGFERTLSTFSSTAPEIHYGVDDLLSLTPSSGTTGAPKGVIKSDRTLRAGPISVLELTEAQPGDVFLLWEPLHHGAGVAVMIAAWLGGIVVAMVRRFSASEFWNQIHRYGVTHMHYLGGVLPILLRQPESDKERTHRVRLAWGGGCPTDIWKEVESRFNLTIREGYGLSELITFVTLNKEHVVGSCGVPISYYDIRVVNDDGQDVAPNEIGEIIAKPTTPGLGFLGYYKNPTAAQEAVVDGWFHTGDLARKDENEFLFYSGRKKNMVRRRGVNISTWEVERVANTFPDVIESALIGVPSDLGEDDLKLFVRVRDTSAFDALSLIKFCEDRMPYFQIPRYVEVIDEFPKTPTERIRTKELSRSVEGIFDIEQTDYKIKH